jgi:hypothetical protein
MSRLCVSLLGGAMTLAFLLALVASDRSTAPATAAARKALQPPEHVAARPTSRGMRVAWTPAVRPRARRHSVWRRAGSRRRWSRIAVTSRSSYHDPAVRPERLYRYRIRALAPGVKRSRPSYTVRAHAQLADHAPSTGTVVAPVTQPEPSRPPGAGATTTVGAAEPVLQAQTDPAPAPAAPTGSIVWRADGESVFDQEWASVSTQTSCGRTLSSGMVDARFQRVSAPAAKGAGAYQSHLQDGDECYGERSETGQGNPTRSSFSDRLFREGEERWISWQVRLGAGFPINVNTWQVVAQWKQLGSLGIPVLSMEARGGGWRFYANPADPNATSGFKTFVLGPAALERWTRFTMHVRFSPDPSVGFIELYGDLADGKGMRQLIARTQTSTMKFDPAKNNQTVDSHARLGIYRDKAISGPADVFYDGYTVATSRAAAEANAF